MNHNSRYNFQYDNSIELMYGAKRNLETDTELLNTNILPHRYTVNDRVDMTRYSTYSIDPAGCEDADDAFSIYEEGGGLFLAIHIADPTEYINLESLMWKDIERTVVTRYPSNKNPIHMVPEEIMHKSSLTENQYGDVKLAITVVTEIEKETYKPVGIVKLLFTTIKVSQENALSYEAAGKLVGSSSKTISIGLKISKALTGMRGGKTRGVVLNEISNSYPKYDNANNVPYLYSDTPNETQMKQMIAEFAIFANSFVGEYLTIKYDGTGLFRSCTAKDWLETVSDEMSG